MLHIIIMTHIWSCFLRKWCTKIKDYAIGKRVTTLQIFKITLSIIMKSSFPSGCTGNPIEEVISENS